MEGWIHARLRTQWDIVARVRKRILFNDDNIYDKQSWRWVEMHSVAS